MAVNSKRSRLFWILTLLFFLCPPSVFAASPLKLKNVLLIHSFEPFLPYSITVNQSIRSTFHEGTKEHVNFYSEYLDLARFPEGEYPGWLVRLYRQKYSKAAPDLIIALLNPAFNFVQKYGGELFPGVPVIFCTVEKHQIEGIALKPNTTGLLMEIDPRATLDAALKLQPETRNVVVISGAHGNDRSYETTVRQAFREYEKKLEFIYLTRMPVEEILNKVRLLPPHTIVIYVTMFQDSTGKAYLPKDVAARISEASNAPVYSLFDSYFGTGIVGGRLVNFELQGKSVAQLGIRILAGEKPSDIPVSAAPNAFMFDWRQLQRWHLPVKRLPVGSDIRYRVPTLWDIYKWQIIGIIFVVAIQSIMTAVLMLQRVKRKRAEEEIRQLNASLEQRVLERTIQLEAANKELESFSYSVSHDLRAPLRAVDGFARILEEDYQEQLGKKGKHVIKVIRDEARRMGQLIDELLRFSRLGRHELIISDIDMTALVGKIYEELHREVRDRTVEFRLDPLPLAEADPALLRQVWVNLLGNALKFTRNVDNAVIEVTGSVRNGEIVYTVRDNGAGFDMRYSNKLFGVFQRLHRQNEFEGTGVGLALVQRIINRHGGRVWAESTVGKGAIFYFSLLKKR